MLKVALPNLLALRTSDEYKHALDFITDLLYELDPQEFSHLKRLDSIA